MKIKAFVSVSNLRALRTFCFIALSLVPICCGSARADETLPAKPGHYCNDAAGVLSAGTKQTLDNQLRQFEADTSNQVIVALYGKMQSTDDMAAYCTRVMQSWQVGQRGKDNGVVLFIFVDDHKLFIATGYGLEGALPDATCKSIIENEIKPHFKTNDFDGGVTAGVAAIISATKGEYKGTGHTAGDSGNGGGGLPSGLFILLVVAIIAFNIWQIRHRGTVYGGSGRYGSWSFGPMIGGGGGGFGGGGGGGGGGGFSGGGGSTGGGGAGGSW